MAPYIQPRYSLVTPEDYQRYADLGTQVYNERRRQEKEAAKANRNSMYAQIGTTIGAKLLPTALEWLAGGGSSTAAPAVGSAASSALAGSAGAEGAAALAGSAGAEGAAALAGSAGAEGAAALAGSAGAEGAAALGAGGLGGAAAIALPVAAAAAGLYAGYRGVDAGIDKWNEGHGSQQQGVNRLLAPVQSGVAQMLGGNGKTGQTMERVFNYLNPITMPLQAASDLGINFWSGKDANQLSRDQWRSDWQDKGVLDDNYGLSLGTGTTNVGAESRADGSKGYNVDWSNQQQKEAAEMAIPLARILSGGDEKKTSDMTGYLSSAITNSGQDPTSAAMELYKKFGFSDRNSAYSRVQQLESQGVLDKPNADAAYAEIDKLFGVS